MRSTFCPSSRKCSAIAVATSGTILRREAASSLVDTTTTARSRASPRVSVTNSITSRPRSPTSATTTVSKPGERDSMESRVDLPTPEPAKIPTRWPRQMGMKMSIAFTPVFTPSPTMPRSMELGAMLLRSRCLSPSGRGPLPSMGSARALMTRPRHWSAGKREKGPTTSTAESILMLAVLSRSWMSALSSWSDKTSASTWR